MTIDEIIFVLNAAKEGKTIQKRVHTNFKPAWFDEPSPVWNFACADYRVKAEPKVIFVNEYLNGDLCGHSSLELAIDRGIGLATRCAVKYVEELS